MQDKSEKGPNDLKRSFYWYVLDKFKGPNDKLGDPLTPDWNMRASAAMMNKELCTRLHNAHSKYLKKTVKIRKTSGGRV